MKVLITGATGLLGGYLLHTLLQRGEQIRALVLQVSQYVALAGERKS